MLEVVLLASCCLDFLVLTVLHHEQVWWAVVPSMTLNEAVSKV